MGGNDVQQLAESVWKAVGAGDWEAVAAFLHEDYVQEWPQSGERIVGKDNTIADNRNFPGGLPMMTFRRTVADGDLVVMETSLEYADGSVYQGISVMEFRDGPSARC